MTKLESILGFFLTPLIALFYWSTPVASSDWMEDTIGWLKDCRAPWLLAVLLGLLAVPAKADLTNAVHDARAAVGLSTSACINWLATPTGWATNTVTTVTTNDAVKVTLTSFLVNNAGYAGITTNDTTASMYSKWQTAIVASNSAKITFIGATWMAGWIDYQALTATPSFTTNTVTTFPAVNFLYQSYGLADMPSGAQVESIP